MNVVLVHGWLSGPRHHWFFWLKRELEKKGFNVIAQKMPTPAKPRKDQWVPALKQILKNLDPSQTILIGHSLGTPTILYALNDHKGKKFAQVILVSGFARKIPHMEEFINGYEMDFDLTTIKSKSRDWVCIHADNDPLVPFAEAEWLADQLGATLINETGRGHLTYYRGTTKLPSALRAVLKEVFSSDSAAVKKSNAPMKLQSAFELVLALRDKIKNKVRKGC
ncbi:MAG: alpha/beta fold hydrolase [Patescibacteria group bacterium]